MGFKMGDLIPSGTLPGPSRAQRGCFGKVPYLSEGAALAAVRASRRREDTCEEGEALRAYRCPRCLKFHVGHNKNRRGE
jgi:hypothetical protein